MATTSILIKLSGSLPICIDVEEAKAEDMAQKIRTTLQANDPGWGDDEVVIDSSPGPNVINWDDLGAIADVHETLSSVIQPEELEGI